MGSWRRRSQCTRKSSLICFADDDERPSGGDESKKSWFIKIAGEPVEKYIHSDGISSTDYFWNETLLGQLFPFSLIGYVNPLNNNEQSLTYVPGFTPVYTTDTKYPLDGNGPFKLVYASPSFTDQKVGPMIGIFIYEINAFTRCILYCCFT